MITRVLDRSSSEKHFSDECVQLDPASAFEDLVLCQITWNTEVIRLKTQRLVIRTRSKEGTTTLDYSGSFEDMLPLIKAAAVHLELQSQTGHRLVHVVALDLLSDLRIPRLTELYGWSTWGEGLNSLVALCALGFEPDPVLLQFKKEDLIAAAYMSYESGLPIAEFLS